MSLNYRITLSALPKYHSDAPEIRDISLFIKTMITTQENGGQMEIKKVLSKDKKRFYDYVFGPVIIKQTVFDITEKLENGICENALQQ